MKALRNFNNLIIFVLVIISFSFIFSGCNGKDFYTVTFKQEGQEDVVITVKAGGSLDESQIPEIIQPEDDGYEKVFWSETNFTNIRRDMEVVANKLGKVFRVVYNITYDGACFEEKDFIDFKDRGWNSDKPLKELSEGVLYKRTYFDGDREVEEFFQIFVYNKKVSSSLPKVTMKNVENNYGFTLWALSTTVPSQDINQTNGLVLENNAYTYVNKSLVTNINNINTVWKFKSDIQLIAVFNVFNTGNVTH